MLLPAQKHTVKLVGGIRRPLDHPIDVCPPETAQESSPTSTGLYQHRLWAPPCSAVSATGRTLTAPDAVLEDAAPHLLLESGWRPVDGAGWKAKAPGPKGAQNPWGESSCETQARARLRPASQVTYPCFVHQEDNGLRREEAGRREGEWAGRLGMGKLRAGLSLRTERPRGGGHLHSRAATGQLWLNCFKRCVSESQRRGAAVSCSPSAVTR